MGERQALTRHMLPWRSQREFNTYLLGTSGISIVELERMGYHQVVAASASTAPRPFATPTGKIELFSQTLEDLGLDPLPAYEVDSGERLPHVEASRYPLILVTGDREKSYHHSRFRDRPGRSRCRRTAAHYASRYGVQAGRATAIGCASRSPAARVPAACV
jgi:anaerobic selenocysteine-containing dehydrogenase